MSEQSSMHFYLNWAKERIDEMDAALTSFEVKATEVKAESKVKADQIVADLKRRRDEFQVLLKTQAEAGQAAWASAKTDLEKHWTGFEAQMKTYLEGAGKHSSESRIDHTSRLIQRNARRLHSVQICHAAGEHKGKLLHF